MSQGFGGLTAIGWRMWARRVEGEYGGRMGRRGWTYYSSERGEYCYGTISARVLYAYLLAEWLERP